MNPLIKPIEVKPKYDRTNAIVSLKVAIIYKTICFVTEKVKVLTPGVT